MQNTAKRLDKTTYIGRSRHLSIDRREIAVFPLHAHDYFEIEIITEGAGVHRLNGKEYPLRKGSALILTPADFHEVLVDEKMTAWNISFDETMMSACQLEAIFLNNAELFQTLNDIELERLDRILSLLHGEATTNDDIRPLFEYFLTVFMKNIDIPDNVTPIRRAILYVETHFRESPSLETAAKQACLSPVYFGNLFKKVTGETYIDYLNSRKINYASMLLKNGVSVTEACFTSGFGSLSVFLYTFKKKKGISPADYKKHNSHR